jgi:hypothetical protein
MPNNGIILKGVYVAASGGQPEDHLRYFWDRVNKIAGSGLGFTNSDNFDGYSRPTNELVDIYNVGTTLYRVKHNGNGGVNTTTEENKILLHASTVGIFIWNKLSKQVESLPEFINVRDAIYNSNVYTQGDQFYFDIDLLYQLESYCVGTTAKIVMPEKTGTDYVNNVRYLTIVNSTSCGYVLPAADVIITETKTIIIESECRTNEVVVKWRNDLGGIDQFKFYNNQTLTLKTNDLGSYDPYFEDLESLIETSVSRGKEARESIIVGVDNLNKDDISGIKWLPLSQEVMIEERDTHKLTHVIISEGSFKWDTKDSLIALEFELILPKIFTVTQ